MPLVFITVSTLPRDASIEVEVFAMTHKAMRYLDCRVSQSGKSQFWFDLAHAPFL